MEKTAVLSSTTKETFDEKTQQHENNDIKNLDTESARSGASSWSISSMLENQLVRYIYTSTYT